MKKITTVMIVMLIALFGISGTAFAKRHHHRHHKKSTTATQTNSGGSATTQGTGVATGQAAVVTQNK